VLEGRLSDYLVLLRMLDPESHRMLAARLAAVDDVQRAHAEVRSVALPQPPRPGEGGQGGTVGWGIEYDLHEESRVAETMRFEARGAIATSDGRRIAMELELEMARVEVQTRSISVRAGDARKVDPLVVNLGAGPATFEGSHRFDLDGDGRTEEIARLAGANAYLARDLNGDGRIGDGRELFGPTTGDGFAELASHDRDGNGWIDEADPIFRELLLWRPASGTGATAPAPTGTLTSAAAAGLGALYLGRVATPFRVQSGGQEQAQVAETSVYLREDGTAGTVQHVDLVV
jgi:hypothetical protein